MSQTSSPVSLQRYYEEAGPDYASWSPRFNMHFGFYRFPGNPLARERMLEQMNREVFQRLGVQQLGRPVIGDLGCGLAATLRSISRQCPHAELHGITVVPWQLAQGTELNRSGPEATAQTRAIDLQLGDYEHTAFPAETFDAVYAVESSCYAHDADKSAFLAEAFRLLRPGGRLVIADGFLSRPNGLIGPQKTICRVLCNCWVIESLGEIPAVHAELERLGFEHILIEPIQARVTLSVLQVPFVTLKFLLTDVVFGSRRMSPARWNNIIAPVLLPFVGKPIGPMAYYLVSATKPGGRNSSRAVPSSGARSEPSVRRTAISGNKRGISSQMKRTSPLKGFLAGALGGILGTLALDLFKQALERSTRAAENAAGRAPVLAGQQARQTVNYHKAHAETAQAVTRAATGSSLGPQAKLVATPLTHYAFGALCAGVYGILAGYRPPITAGHGTAFGTSLFLASNEVTLPVLGLLPAATETPAILHAEGVASHALYGAVAESTRSLFRG